MTRFPHDEFAKGFLESLLSPLGQVQTSLKISSEVREIDVYFIPDGKTSPPEELGLLGQFATTSSVFEPFRNPVKINQIRSCMGKLYDLHSTLIREGKKLESNETNEESLPNLWILTPTLSTEILTGFGAKRSPEWVEGVYLLPPRLKTGIVVIHQLPETSTTLWFRLLGRTGTQKRAIAEVAKLPPEHPYRQGALELLGNLKVILEARKPINNEEEELIMQLSPLYLEQIKAAERIGEQWGEQRGVLKGRQDIVLRQLNRRVGNVSNELQLQIKSLSLVQLEELGEGLLDFTSVEDLENWMNQMILIR
jgi:hypothetical protein